MSLQAGESHRVVELKFAVDEPRSFVVHMEQPQSPAVIHLGPEVIAKARAETPPTRFNSLRSLAAEDLVLAVPPDQAYRRAIRYNRPHLGGLRLGQ